MGVMAFVAGTGAAVTRRRSPTGGLRRRARWGRVRMSADKEGEEGANGSTKPCTYCDGRKIVLCPVCKGEGVVGRTILCRYCKGKKELDCPVCAVEDDYAWTYNEGGLGNTGRNS
mmetsp:Transcript_2586/g.7754  ORF Transcript_2586/g.7754 Transcript_2586/m.7754 type:complete len:115 (-) Transcript_2586:1232-1576(-)